MGDGVGFSGMGFAVVFGTTIGFGGMAVEMTLVTVVSGTRIGADTSFSGRSSVSFFFFFFLGGHCCLGCQCGGCSR